MFSLCQTALLQKKKQKYNYYYKFKKQKVFSLNNLFKLFAKYLKKIGIYLI